MDLKQKSSFIILASVILGLLHTLSANGYVLLFGVDKGLSDYLKDYLIYIGVFSALINCLFFFKSKLGVSHGPIIEMFSTGVKLLLSQYLGVIAVGTAIFSFIAGSEVKYFFMTFLGSLVTVGVNFFFLLLFFLVLNLIVIWFFKSHIWSQEDIFLEN